MQIFKMLVRNLQVSQSKTKAHIMIRIIQRSYSLMDLNMTSIRRHLLDNVLFRKKQVWPRACKIIKTRKTLETRYQFHIILFLYAQILQDYFFLLQKNIYIFAVQRKQVSMYMYVLYTHLFLIKKITMGQAKS